MKRQAPLWITCLLVVTVTSVCVASQSDADKRMRNEIDRRGDMVVHVTKGVQAERGLTALAPPADDSNKWFISVVGSADCVHCKQLLEDWHRDRRLQAYATPDVPKESWAHWHYYDVDDETQSWRWKDIKLQGYPTILIQPPLDRSYGDPATVVMQHTGYSSARKLADTMRDSIIRYARTYQPSDKQQSSAIARGAGGAEEQIGVDPPFTLPKRPNRPEVPSVPFQIPPIPGPDNPQAIPGVGALLMLLFGGMFGGAGLTNVLLIVLMAMQAWRDWRKKHGLKVLLGDKTFEELKEILQSMIDADPPKKDEK